jgi:transposase
VILSYRYRLLPTRAQHRALGEILEEQRRLYNDALAERIDAYRRSVLEVERGRRAKPQTITFFDQTNSLTTIRNDPLTREELSRLPAFLQQWTLKRLDDAYKAFFRRVRASPAHSTRTLTTTTRPIILTSARRPTCCCSNPTNSTPPLWSSTRRTTTTR